MTEQTTSEARVEAEGLVRWLEPENEPGPWPCWVRTPQHCPNTAVMKVYDLPFCEVHGAECRDGAFEEIYQDATEWLSRFDNPHVPNPNWEALRVLREGVSELRGKARFAELASEESIQRAYPVYGREVDEDYFVGYDHLREIRFTLHKLMRLAFEAGEDWILEKLERDREDVAAQLAWLLRSGRS